jgi:hypothetical protein
VAPGSSFGTLLAGSFGPGLGCVKGAAGAARSAVETLDSPHPRTNDSIRRVPKGWSVRPTEEVDARPHICDMRKAVRRYQKTSHACSANVHGLCRFIVVCPCSCHVDELREVLEQLLEECDRQAIRYAG